MADFYMKRNTALKWVNLCKVVTKMYYFEEISHENKSIQIGFYDTTITSFYGKKINVMRIYSNYKRT